MSKVHRLLRGAFLPGVLLAATLLRGASAEAPRPLLRGLPQGAHVAMESDDLRALLERWRDAPLRKAFQKSALRREMERGKIFLRLLARVEAMEEITGYPITLDRLIRGAGRRFALGLYDIGETSFVLVTEIPIEEARRSDLLGLRGRLGAREHQGVPYLVSEAPKGTRRAPLCVALIGARLLVGNALAPFQEALLLTARELGAGQARPGQGVAPFTEDPAYTGLQPAAQAVEGRSALRIYVKKSALYGNRYFDRYWLLGRTSAQGIEAAFLSLTLGESASEMHAYLYQAGTSPPQIAEQPGEIGAADVPRLVAALPPRVPYAQSMVVDTAEAAALIAEMLPLPQREAEARAGAVPPDVAGGLEQALSDAAPFRAVEVADAQREGLLVRQRGAVAFSLRRKEALSPVQLEHALLAGLEQAFGVGHGGPELEFSDSKNARVLRLPLIPEWALTWERRDDVLFVGTDTEMVEQLKASLGNGAALRADGPLLRRIDLERAGAHYRAVMKVLVQREAFSESATADLYDKAVGGIPDLLRPVRRVLSASYRRGPLLVEEVHYLP